MNEIAIFNILAFIFMFCSLLFLFKINGKFGKSTLFIFSVIILLKMFLFFSNILEWGFNLPLLDELEDFIEIIECTLWGFLINSYLQFKDKQQILKDQEEILKLRKTESISTMVSGITHDFRNHLAIILGSLELLELEKDLNMSVEYIDQAKKAIDRATRLSNDLLNLTGKIKLSFQDIAIHPFIQDIVNLTLCNFQTKVHFFGFNYNIYVKCDKKHIERVFHNLILNAAQSMNGEGLVEIKSKKVKVENNEIFGLNAGNYCQFDIQDFGTGIKPEYIKSIFDPYFTTKKNGMGLGLAVSLNIIRKHGGTILVSSKVNRGTNFSVFLPL